MKHSIWYKCELLPPSFLYHIGKSCQSTISWKYVPMFTKYRKNYFRYQDFVSGFNVLIEWNTKAMQKDQAHY